MCWRCWVEAVTVVGGVGVAGVVYVCVGAVTVEQSQPVDCHRCLLALKRSLMKRLAILAQDYRIRNVCLLEGIFLRSELRQSAVLGFVL